MSTCKRIELVIERTEDGHAAYPLGLKGVVVAQGDTYEEAEEAEEAVIAETVASVG